MATKKYNLIKYLAAMFALIPQIYLSNDVMGYSTTVDLLGLAVVAFIVFGVLKVQKDTSVSFLFFWLLLSFITTSVRLAELSIVDSTFSMYSYIARHFFIHSTLIVALALSQGEEKNFFDVSFLFSIVFIASSIFILYIYSQGIDWFDAHQTLEGDTGSRYHRLGGLTGESGAYGFNLVVGAQLTLMFIISKFKNTVVVLLGMLSLTMLIGAGYTFSQTRILLINWGFFIFLVMFVTPVFGLLTKSFFAVLGAVAVLIAVLFFEIPFDLFSRFDTKGGGLSEFSSGRVDHWAYAIEIWLSRIDYILFGVGHRFSEPMLGHAVENFLIYNLFSYGIVGSLFSIGLIFLILYRLAKLSVRGDTTSIILICAWCANLMQAMINDIFTYYQTYPVLLLMSYWRAMMPKRNDAR